jgi:integrase
MNVSTRSIDRNASGPLMTEASQIYLKAKGKSRPLTFTQAVNRSVRYLVSVAGDKPIDSYVREDANSLREALIAKGLSRASIKRTLSVLRAAINFTTRELELDEVKVFSGVYLGEPEELTHTTRRPIPIKDVYKVQALCRKLDDEPRWLIALISDTGMRLSEATGLIIDDVKLDDPYPHILLQPHPWRRLKTQSSEIIIPLVGASL